jgi:hypothetical protein
MRTYAGTFLIAFATLALEIALTRLLSVATWYHLAFFAISTAMLGMTAGATYVYLRPDRFTPERLHGTLARACANFAMAVPATLVVLCLVPLWLTSLVMTMVAMGVATLACSLPFYYAGIAVTAVLTRSSLPVTRVYGSDLIGAAMGCLFVLAGLELMDVPSLILLCGAVGALAGLAYNHGEVRRRPTRLAGALAVGIGLIAALNAVSGRGIQPVTVKGRLENPDNYLKQEWNSFSRVVVYPGSERPPYYWGASPIAPRDVAFQYFMNIDGDAGTTLAPIPRGERPYLWFDVTNVGYYLRSSGGAAVIGVGGGRDVQSALVFGHERVTGIEVNPVFIDLLENDFRELAGIGGRDDVDLVVDDARSWLSRSTERYAILQMSMIDTWAATGAGAFSLSENGLYTVEAWRVFFDRLQDDGIFTVSRWHREDDLGETGRIVSLAVATLLDAGVAEPGRHLALITSSRLSTLLMARRPFTADEIAILAQVAERLQFEAAVLPGRAVANPTLAGLLSVTSRDELERVARSARVKLEPPTDESPFFFNMLRPRDLIPGFRAFFGRDAQAGVVAGNMAATVVLMGLILSLLALTVVTVLVPLGVRALAGGGREGAVTLWSGAAYFSLIGAGFMLAEIALIQRLSVFLGHPVYALGILLFTIILSTGMGSLLSERLPLTRAPWVYVYPLVTAAAIASFPFLFPPMAGAMVASSMGAKILASIAIVAPTGVLMGFFFPTGMRLVAEIASADTPWYWALNGVFGVLMSAVAVFISIHFGISVNLWMAAGCYVAVVGAVVAVRRA